MNADIARLSPEDEQALDVLIAAGLNPVAVAPQHRRRAEAVARTLALLDHLPEERTGDLLVERTLQAVERERQKETFAQQIESLSRGRSAMAGVSLRDVAAMAAMFILTVSLLWPMLNAARTNARQIACQANLGMAGQGLMTYAADFGGAMPVTRFQPGDHWNRVNQFDQQGNAQSNSAHLFVAVRNGYVSLRDVGCPDNADAPKSLPDGARDFPRCSAISYSYQNQYTARRPRLNRGIIMAIMADKNPFFEGESYHWDMRPDTNSSNHTRRGQNALMSDGRVRWLSKPFCDRDNIFHIGDEGWDYYTGQEAPASVDDAFLVP